MKLSHQRVTLFFCFFTVLSNYSCKKTKNVPPLAPTTLTAATASINQIDLSWTDNSTNENGFKIQRKTGSSPYSDIATINRDITIFNDNGLVPNTTYTYRVYAYNSTGNSLTYTNEASATTNGLPQVTTTAITDNTGLSVISGGNISYDGGLPISSRGVVWSTNTNPTIALTTKTSDGKGSGTFTSNITGLTPNTTYYIKAYATNSAGTTYGNELSFKTYDVPQVTTIAVTNITGSSCNSGGNISNDGGLPINSRGVVWSTNTNPTITLATKSSDGTSSGTFTSNITGLTPNTTYYIRAYATNSAGTSYGNEFSFKTIAVDITTGLVGYWPFNNNANDESGNGNHGTVNGATLTADRFGNGNKAYSFNGVNNFISTNLTGTFANGLTICAWIKTNYIFSPTDYVHKGIVFSRMTGPPNNFNTGLMIYGSGTLFNAANNTQTYSILDNQYYNDNLWHQITATVAITNSNTIITLYIDGLQKNQITFSSTQAIRATSSFKFGLDEISGYGNRFWDGLIDDIRIYNRALTQEQIIFLFNN